MIDWNHISRLGGLIEQVSTDLALHRETPHGYFHLTIWYPASKQVDGQALPSPIW